jgi:hypothetical protein
MIFDILGFSMEAMGTPWGPHGVPWGPMGTHGNPWGPMGTHGNPWEPMGPMDFPWIFHELSGRPEADKKCGGVWGGGGSPPPRGWEGRQIGQFNRVWQAIHGRVTHRPGEKPQRNMHSARLSRAASQLLAVLDRNSIS